MSEGTSLLPLGRHIRKSVLVGTGFYGGNGCASLSAHKKFKLTFIRNPTTS